MTSNFTRKKLINKAKLALDDLTYTDPPQRLKPQGQPQQQPLNQDDEHHDANLPRSPQASISILSVHQSEFQSTTKINITSTLTMKKLINKAKSALDDLTYADPPQRLKPRGNPQQQVLHQAGSSTVQPPTIADVIRYRYQHGTNIGSIFIQERWLTGSMFPEGAEGSSELAAAQAWINELGIDGARQRHEQHWREYVSDSHLDWLRDVARCNAVRLPVGYFTLGPAYCADTPFKDVAAIYQNAWQAVKDFVARCAERGIGVLIDVHGLPGGANAQEHSGSNSGKAEFWSSKLYKKHATKCMCFIADQARSMSGVLGIQIVNEAEWDARGMYDWYDDVLTEVSKIDPSIPIYISDGWDFNRALNWSQTRNLVHSANPVVVDTHLYWCFTDADQQRSPLDIIEEAWNKLGELNGKEGSVHDRGAAQAIVGEYSCVLGEASWQKGGDVLKEDHVRNFGNAQSICYQQRAGGSFFWTYAMDWMPGGEWGFVQMNEHGAIIPPSSLALDASEVRSKVANAHGQRDGRRGNTWGAHCQYWDSNHPGDYEHWRFEQGWNLGWDDAVAFFSMRGNFGLQGGDKIGMLELWVLKRLRESGQSGPFTWEYEEGLRQGMRDFWEVAGV